MLDLHMHTTCSDGVDSPKELLRKVIAAGCKLFSVTDHDCIEAINEINSELKAYKHDITFISGMEVSSVFKGHALHILCYNFDCGHESIAGLFEEKKRLRVKKIAALFEHLSEKHGIIIPQSDIMEILSHPCPKKSHIAEAALKNGLTDLPKYDFITKYLEDMDKVAFNLPAEKVIHATCTAGGFTSFAHPIKMQNRYDMDYDALDNFIRLLADCGLYAIEAYHYLHKESDVKNCKVLAKKYNLKITAGSDYHGKKEYTGVANLGTDDANCILKGLPL